MKPSGSLMLQEIKRQKSFASAGIVSYVRWSDDGSHGGGAWTIDGGKAGIVLSCFPAKHSVTNLNRFAAQRRSLAASHPRDKHS